MRLVYTTQLFYIILRSGVHLSGMEYHFENPNKRNNCNTTSITSRKGGGAGLMAGVVFGFPSLSKDDADVSVAIMLAFFFYFLSVSSRRRTLKK